MDTSSTYTLLGFVLGSILPPLSVLTIQNPALRWMCFNDPEIIRSIKYNSALSGSLVAAVVWSTFKEQELEEKRKMR